MVTVAEFTLEPDEFPLGAVFEEQPDATVRLERIVPDASGGVPYFWVRGAKTDAIAEQFTGHPGVRDVRLVDCVDDEYLMQCEWVSEHESVLDALVEPQVVLLSAVGTAEEWTFEVRGESRESIATFRNYCHEHDVQVTLSELRALERPDGHHDLTEKQHEAVILAFERGYFDSPRETTLRGVAEELGISQQALASRLRRGTRRLVVDTLVETRT